MISAEKQRRFSCPHRNYCSLNIMINLSTRAPRNCLPFQKQTANDEVQTTLFCLRLYNTVLTTRGHFTHFVHYRCTEVQVFTVLFRSLLFLKKYVRLNHDESFSDRLALRPHPVLALHQRDPQDYCSVIGMNRTEHYGCESLVFLLH